METNSIWITGPTRSGKTTRLVEQFRLWVQSSEPVQVKPETATPPKRRRVSKIDSLSNTTNQRQFNLKNPGILVFAANGWLELADRISQATNGKYPAETTTPLRFFRDEVILFWPLLIQELNLTAQFPLRLRPETEQELATKLWRDELDAGLLRQEGVSDYRMVRRTLDLLQLAAAAGVPVEEIPSILQAGTSSDEDNYATFKLPIYSISTIGELLLRWRSWCWQRGFLTYGLICELYWRHLLPHPSYQQYLTERYQIVLADDVDEYPAITRQLFEVLLDNNLRGAFTYNPDCGGVRLGLDADPNYMAGLSGRCQVINLHQRSDNLGYSLGEPVVEMVINSNFQVPSFAFAASVRSIQKTARSQLLRETAEEIINAVKTKQVEPKDIAIITPGLDAIARYTLIEILNKKGIYVEPLNEQRPLASSPIIRGLLTLLALVYPGLGRLVDCESVAEMLVVLSPSNTDFLAENEQQELDFRLENKPVKSKIPNLKAIDPVRAGLLVDHCFFPDPKYPKLLSVTHFPRWDRLGYRAKEAYQEIVEWLKKQRKLLEEGSIANFVMVLDQAIKDFLWRETDLPMQQVTAVRELIEMGQHYWEVDSRLRQIQPNQDLPVEETVSNFIELLRRGTISANPYRGLEIWPPGGAVTLGTIFQYRFNRRFHRWQFWLDAGSNLWESSGEAARFGAPLFWKNWEGKPWSIEQQNDVDRERLRRILIDLLSRAGERVYFCHSDLAVNGEEQTGALFNLVNASKF